MFSFRKRKARWGLACSKHIGHYHGWQWSLGWNVCSRASLDIGQVWKPCKKVTVAAKEMECAGLDSPMPFQRKAGRDQKKKCPSLWIYGWVLWPLCARYWNNVKIQWLAIRSAFQKLLWGLGRLRELTQLEYGVDWISPELWRPSWNQSSGSEACPRCLEAKVQPADITNAWVISTPVVCLQVYTGSDLVIRTRVASHLSNFLPWQTAYSKLYFTDILWPDFGEKALKDAVNPSQSTFGRCIRRRKRWVFDLQGAIFFWRCSSYFYSFSEYGGFPSDQRWPSSHAAVHGCLRWRTGRP